MDEAGEDYVDYDQNIKDPRNILIDMLMGTESDYSDEGEELWHYSHI